MSADVQRLVTRYLDALAGTARGEFLELRYRLPDGERMGHLFESTARLSALAARIVALGRSTDVYVGCAPRTRRTGGREAVLHSFTLWADCDGEAAAHALQDFSPAPSILIASGTGANRHAYWLLSDPVESDALEVANLKLAHALGADVACAEPARILRPPGTLSHKARPPAEVRALQLDSDRRFSLQAVVGGLPEPPVLPTSATREVTQPGRLADPLLGIAPEVYVSRLLEVEVPRHRKVPCPFHPDERPSLHVYETARRGWFCFGSCRRGGTIYDFAGPLLGFGLRGEGFLHLRAELLRLFAEEVG